MKNMARFAILSAGLLIFAGVRAHACTSAPEVDPSLAVGGLTFLAGSLAVLRARFRK